MDFTDYLATYTSIAAQKQQLRRAACAAQTQQEQRRIETLIFEHIDILEEMVARLKSEAACSQGLGGVRGSDDAPPDMAIGPQTAMGS